MGLVAAPSKYGVSSMLSEFLATKSSRLNTSLTRASIRLRSSKFWLQHPFRDIIETWSGFITRKELGAYHVDWPTIRKPSNMPQKLFNFDPNKAASVLLEHPTHFEEQLIMLALLVNRLDYRGSAAVALVGIHFKTIADCLEGHFAVIVWLRAHFCESFLFLVWLPQAFLRAGSAPSGLGGFRYSYVTNVCFDSTLSKKKRSHFGPRPEPLSNFVTICALGYTFKKTKYKEAQNFEITNCSIHESGPRSGFFDIVITISFPVADHLLSQA